MEKRCTKCKKVKPVENFNWKKRAKGLRQSACKICTRKQVKSHYSRNKTYYLDKTSRQRQKLYDWFKTLKRDKRCERCGEDHIACLDFHHTRDKDFNIGGAIYSCISKKKILAEVEKCIVLCSNCHRKEH